MNNIEFKTLIEEKKSFVLERHGYYKQLEESGELHNNEDTLCSKEVIS